MNHFVPDWSNMGDTSRVLGEDDELIELLWRNGHVVMQSQTNRRPPRPEKAAAGIQEDEAATWSPYALADSLERDLFAELFYDVPAAAVDADKSSKEEAAAGGQKHGGAGAATGAQQDLMPPPKLTHAAGSGQQQTASLPDGKNAGDLSDLVRSRTVGSEKAPAKEPMESSMLSTIGSSFCGSNQVPMQRAVSTPGRTGASDTAFGSTLPWAGGNETTVASSSGRSNYCYSEAEPPGASDQRGKRKRRDTEESKSTSEDADFESAAACKPPQKLTTARRSRAAEVHNLSERRRRDRINEKMRALQELIPHCNKTDKASMLDEAIEYLKTLQLQLQMMWMGSGMAPPMMFPGIHQYIPQMGIGMSTPTPSMPRMPFMPQPVVPNPPVSSVPLCAAGNHNPSNFGNHMPSVSLPEPYAHYLGVNHLQPPSQGLSFYPLGATTVQQNLVPALPSGSLPSATTGAQTSENTPTKKSG